MRKKTLLIPTFTALFCGFLGSAPGAFAETEIYGTRYWSVSELVALNEEVNAEMGEKCAADIICADDYRLRLYERGGKYRALEKLVSTPLTVTSVNPSANTIKVYYNDKTRGNLQGVADPNVRKLQTIYIYWTDRGIEKDPLDSYNNIAYHVNLMLEQSVAEEGVHPMIVWNEETIRPFPVREEVPFTIGSGSLTDNTKGHIYYGIGSNIIGASVYSDCINNSAFKKGTECQAIFGENSQVTYLPVGGIDEEPEAISEPEVISEPEITPEPEVTPEPETISEPEIVPEPEISPEPEIVSEPEPEVIPESDPESISEPETISGSESEAALELEVTPESETPSEPEVALELEKVAVLEVVPESTQKPAEESSQKKTLNYTTAAKIQGATEEIETEQNNNNNQEEEIAAVPVLGNTASSDTSKEKGNFPWWLVVILFLADGLAVWWFLPTSRKNQRKR